MKLVRCEERIFTGDRQLVGSVVLIADSIAYQLGVELFSG